MRFSFFIPHMMRGSDYISFLTIERWLEMEVRVDRQGSLECSCPVAQEGSGIERARK